MRVFKLMLIAVLAILFWVNPALAAEGAEGVTKGALELGPWNGLGAGLAIGLAALGGALGQGKAGSAALEGIGRNPGASGQMFLPFILSLVFVESLVIYALVVAIKLTSIGTIGG